MPHAHPAPLQHRRGANRSFPNKAAGSTAARQAPAAPPLAHGRQPQPPNSKHTQTEPHSTRATRRLRRRNQRGASQPNRQRTLRRQRDCPHITSKRTQVGSARGSKREAGTRERGEFEHDDGACLRAHGDEHGNDLCQGPAHKAGKLRADLGGWSGYRGSGSVHMFRGRGGKDKRKCGIEQRTCGI